MIVCVCEREREAKSRTRKICQSGRHHQFFINVNGFCILRIVWERMKRVECKDIFRKQQEKKQTNQNDHWEQMSEFTLAKNAPLKSTIIDASVNQSRKICAIEIKWCCWLVFIKWIEPIPLILLPLIWDPVFTTGRYIRTNGWI